MKRFILFVIMLAVFSVSFSLFAQTDTLSWNYVVNQPWTKPARLDSFAGIHPRMLLNAAKVETLKTKITTTHKFIWNVIKPKADNYLSSNPNNSPGDESDTRRDGDAVPWIAMAYLMTNDAKYLDKAVSWMTTICNYSTWDGNHSLGAGHCLMGVSLGYDWLYNAMTSGQRQTIRDRLSYFAPAMASSPQHRERYLSNHCQVEYAGLAAAGFALYDEVAEAESWLRQAYNIFNEAFQIFGNDGSSTEGHQYYGLMTEFQMHFNKMAKELLGRNFYEESEWLKNLGYFILYSTLPNYTSDRCVMRYGDTKYTDYNGHGPVYQLFNVASEYRDPYLQWMALDMFDRGVGTTHRMGWSNLLWYDETIPASPLDSLPTFRHFEDTGWITSRSDWSRYAIMLGFKCGPFHGHAVQALYDKMTGFHQIVNGHGHPDVNHFNIHAYGKWLAEDDGYSKPKWTKYHNTILVNGIGQLGEGSSWFNRSAVFNANATSRIIKAESDSILDYIIGDAQNIYKSSSGLKEFFRHFVYVRPNIIIVLDELKADKPSKFDWLMNTDGEISKTDNSRYEITTGDVIMDVNFLLPEAVSDNNSYKLMQISPADSVAEALILAVMHIRKKADSTATVKLSSQSDSTLTVEICIGGQKKSVVLRLVGKDKQTGIIPQNNKKFSEVPKGFRLFQNYPNPFNPVTAIRYQLPETCRVFIAVHDLSGRVVNILVNNELQKVGKKTVIWDGKTISGEKATSGLYLYTIQAGDFKQTKRMVLLK